MFAHSRISWSRHSPYNRKLLFSVMVSQLVFPSNECSPDGAMVRRRSKAQGLALLQRSPHKAWALDSDQVPGRRGPGRYRSEYNPISHQPWLLPAPYRSRKQQPSRLRDEESTQGLSRPGIARPLIDSRAAAPARTIIAFNVVERPILKNSKALTLAMPIGIHGHCRKTDCKGWCNPESLRLPPLLSPRRSQSAAFDRDRGFYTYWRE